MTRRPHHDPRPWQDSTREDIRKGDLVDALDGDRPDGTPRFVKAQEGEK